MEPIFALPYSEYAVINEFSRHLRKGDGFSIYVPTSRQEKGVDFLVYNSQYRKSLRFQVKGSRSYVEDDPRSLAKGNFRFCLWFNNFRKRYTAGETDYYVLFGLYPEYAVDKAIHARRSFWRTLILCFLDGEMKELLDSVLTKRERKPDRFFYVEFDSPGKVCGTRGFLDFPDGRGLTPYLLKNRLERIKADLTSGP